jgi:hypothetical protein
VCYHWRIFAKVVWCFPVVVTVAVVVTIVVTSCQLRQFCGALSFSSDAPILHQFYGVAQLSTLARV